MTARISTQVLGKLSSLSRLLNPPDFMHLPRPSQTAGAHHHGSRGTLKVMQAHRVLIETDEHGRPKDLPALPPHAKVEAIFLVLEEGGKVSCHSPGGWGHVSPGPWGQVTGIEDLSDQMPQVGRRVEPGGALGADVRAVIGGVRLPSCGG